MDKNEAERRRHRVDAYWGIGILIVMFGLTFYFGLKDDKKAPIVPVEKSETQTIIASQDSVKSLKTRIVYSEFYEEGYKKGYAAGEEDTNDGDYRSGFDDNNPYKGQQASDYCLGYEQGYEDAYEEIIDTSDDDEEEPI